MHAPDNESQCQLTQYIPLVDCRPKFPNAGATCRTEDASFTVVSRRWTISATNTNWLRKQPLRPIPHCHHRNVRMKQQNRPPTSKSRRRNPPRPVSTRTRFPLPLNIALRAAQRKRATTVRIPTMTVTRFEFLTGYHHTIQ
jgi:hypothetical protein